MREKRSETSDVRGVCGSVLLQQKPKSPNIAAHTPASRGKKVFFEKIATMRGMKKVATESS